jgi:hypothetical protein
MVKNKSPISCAFGNSAVVPLGQVIIKNDLHVLFEIGSVFAPRFIHLVQPPYRHAQACRGLRPFDEGLCDVHRVNDHPLAGVPAVWTHPGFERIVRGTGRRSMGHTHLQPQAIDYPLQVFLAQRRRGAVAAATVTKPRSRVAWGCAVRPACSPHQATLSQHQARVSWLVLRWRCA